MYAYVEPSEVEELLACGCDQGKQRFDVIVAADTVFLHRLHDDMLHTCEACLKEGSGVLLVGFSLHANVVDEKVFSFFDKAKAKGFSVEECRLPSLESRNEEFVRQGESLHILRSSALHH